MTCVERMQKANKVNSVGGLPGIYIQMRDGSYCTWTLAQKGTVGCTQHWIKGLIFCFGQDL